MVVGPRVALVIFSRVVDLVALVVTGEMVVVVVGPRVALVTCSRAVDLVALAVTGEVVVVVVAASTCTATWR